MIIRSLTIEGYRSIQRLHFPAQQVNVIVGANGTGKSNLYLALYLLTAAADGRLADSLAIEGGMESVLWAGPHQRKVPKRVTLDVMFDAWSYQISFGLPQPIENSAFNLDPFVREERLRCHDGKRAIEICSRTNGTAWLRDDDGRRVTFPAEISDSESILSELREPHLYPELSHIRSELSSWRFYHQFRTDSESALRRPQIAVRTTVLGHDGRNLAAALQTIIEIGDRGALSAAISHAFPGGSLEIDRHHTGLELSLSMPNFVRPFRAPELSDGTLKYLCLLAALLSPRPSNLLAFNEPDANLHPSLFEPLSDAFAFASRESQLWITTHSTELAEMIARKTGAQPIELTKQKGATILKMN